LDLARDCDLLNLNATNLDIDSWMLIRNALLEAFTFRPNPGQVFIENFNCKTLKLAENPKLGEAAVTSLIQLCASGFPVTHIDLSSNELVEEKCTKALGELMMECRSLETYSIHDNNFGAKNSLQILKYMKENLALRVLNVSNCGLKDLFCFPLALIIASHPTLVDVDLSNNSITDDGLKKLIDGIRRTRSLDRLNLSSTKIKSGEVKNLIPVSATMGRPTQLILSNNKLSEKTAVLLGQVLEKKGTVSVFKHLNLHDTQIKKKGTTAIFQSLETNTWLEFLSIGANEIDKAGATALCKSLRANVTLKVLHLKNCSLGLEGYIELSKGLSGNAALTELDLTSNTLNPLEFKKITDAIVVNRSLTSLNVSYNTKIGVDGLTAFMSPLAANSNMILSKIHLDGCQINDDGARKIGEMLNSNVSIEKLSLKQNQIGTEGAISILTGLKNNKRLGILNLEKNEINSNDQKVIELKNAASVSKVITLDTKK